MPISEEEKRNPTLRKYNEDKARLNQQVSKNDLGTLYGPGPRNYDSVDDDIEADAIPDRIEHYKKEPKMNPSPKNDFTGYNEAHALVEAGIENCNSSSGNTKGERAGWLIDVLPRAEEYNGLIDSDQKESQF